MEVTRKSIGMIVDELITTNIKCFMEQEKIVHGEDDYEVAEAARNAQSLNARRSALIKAIDYIFDDGDITPTAKTYGG